MIKTKKKSDRQINKKPLNLVETKEENQLINRRSLV